MSAMAHDLVVDLSPDELGDGPADLRMRDEVTLWAAIPLAIAALIAASVVAVSYHVLVLLWVLLGLPLLRLIWATGHVAATGVGKVGARFNAARQRSGNSGKQEVTLTFDELTLIYKSLQAAKTLGALPPHDELLEDTIQLVDHALNRVVD
jgi:hypothetical protein